MMSISSDKQASERRSPSLPFIPLNPLEHIHALTQDSAGMTRLNESEVGDLADRSTYSSRHCSGAAAFRN